MSIERIARIVGKGTYRDLRDGFTPGSLLHDADVDIKAALGMAQREVGAIPVAALETRYASTLMHEQALLRAWDRVLASGTDHSVAVHRVGGSLALRHFARGEGHVQGVSHYAWLVRTRRENLLDKINDCLDWLHEQSITGTNAFLLAMGQVREVRRSRRPTSSQARPKRGPDTGA